MKILSSPGHAPAIIPFDWIIGNPVSLCAISCASAASRPAEARSEAAKKAAETRAERYGHQAPSAETKTGAKTTVN